MTTIEQETIQQNLLRLRDLRLSLGQLTAVDGGGFSAYEVQEVEQLLNRMTDRAQAKLNEVEA